VNRPIALVFDVNETLLDLAPMREDFEAVFGPSPPLGEWFARLLHGSLVANHLNQFRPFSEIGVEALLALAGKLGTELDQPGAEALVARLEVLAAHRDVIPAMERLVDAGFKTAALTNGSTRAANAQIENAGLHVFIQRVISVDEVGRFKPDPTPYRYAAGQLEVEPLEMLMVAAHDWDVAGAMRAGARGAYVARGGIPWSLPGIEPDVAVDDLGHLATVLDTG
jgi:2-haloacid dehalogenase